MGNTIQVKSQNDVAMIICKKQLVDEGVGRELVSAIRSLLAEGLCKTYLVDISHVQRMNSMGIGALVEASSRVQKQGCRFIVCGMQPNVVDLLTMVRCLFTWEEVQDCREARSALGFD